MYNIVLDKLPTEYKGYLIRSDFRVGIQISTCLSDDELTTEERITSASFLLFGSGVPDINTAWAGIVWFLSCGQKEISIDDIESESTGEKEAEVLSLEQDITCIYSAFRKCYGIDLARAQMHWFEFCALLSDISGCLMTNIIEIRTTKTSDVDKKNRGKLLKLKSKYAIIKAESMTEEEKAAIDRFEELDKARSRGG